MKWLRRLTLFIMPALTLAFPVLAVEDAYLITAKPGSFQNNNLPKDMSDPGAAALGNVVSESLLRRPGTVDQGLTHSPPSVNKVRDHV